MRRYLNVVFMALALCRSNPAYGQQHSVEVIADHVRLRSTASIEADIIATIPRGARVGVLDREGNWVHVSYGEKQGYVRANLLAPSESLFSRPAAPTATVTERAPTQNAPEPTPLPPAPQKRRDAPETSTDRVQMRGFEPGHTYLGPTLGLGNLGSASASIGGRVERAAKALPDLGNGVLGFGLDADFYHWSDSFSGGQVSINAIALGGTANYHFVVSNNRAVDPFLGIGLGYTVATASEPGFSTTGLSGIYFIGKAGARYFFSDQAAGQIDLGLGSAVFALSLIIKL